MTPFDRAVLEYLKTLHAGALPYAVHYAHHLQAGTLSNVVQDGWSTNGRHRAGIRRVVDRLWREAQAAEDTEVTRAEDAIEDGQSRWSETGSTRR